MGSMVAVARAENLTKINLPDDMRRVYSMGEIFFLSHMHRNTAGNTGSNPRIIPA
jgi:hypothetical protein